jgi:uncharacterized protein with GYD domain
LGRRWASSSVSWRSKPKCGNCPVDIQARWGRHQTRTTALQNDLAAISDTEKEEHMPTFILSLNWTDQGIRSVKDAPKRAQASQEMARKLGVEIKEVYLTSGDSDILIIADAQNGDSVAKFALALGALGNVRTRTARAWPQAEFQKLISELP